MDPSIRDRGWNLEGHPFSRGGWEIGRSHQNPCHIRNQRRWVQALPHAVRGSPPGEKEHSYERPHQCSARKDGVTLYSSCNFFFLNFLMWSFLLQFQLYPRWCFYSSVSAKSFLIENFILQLRHPQWFLFVLPWQLFISFIPKYGAVQFLLSLYNC